MTLQIAGVAASPGQVEGIFVLADGQEDEIPENAILLTYSLTPKDFLMLLRCKAAVAIIGGFTSHAAILCRELGLPAVTGVSRNDWRDWRMRRAVVDGSNGRVTILETEDANA
jgi:pyruvate,water dikinase